MNDYPHKKESNIFTSWKLWCAVSLGLGVLLLTNISNLKGIFPYLLLLICPISMMFMMRDHHK